MSNSENWKWYLGTNDEYYDMGSFDTREEALKKAENHDKPLYLCRARKIPVQLSWLFDGNDFIDNAEENANDITNGYKSEIYEDDFFNLTKEQIKDLEETVKTAIDKWQKKNKLVFIPTQFSEVDNEEVIE